MKAYVILQVSYVDGPKVVAEGDTREEAFAGLKEIAEVGEQYQEMRTLGDVIEPRERTAVTLSRVATKKVGAATEKPEDTEPENEPAVEPEAEAPVD